MPWFHTTYRSNWALTAEVEEACRVGAYSGWLWAASKSAAKDVAKERGMGERVDFKEFWKKRPFPRASDLVLSRPRTILQNNRVMHGLCFLGQLALASSAATMQEIIGDEGIIHEWCHRLPRKVLAEQVRRIEEKVPGYLPRKAHLRY